MTQEHVKLPLPFPFPDPKPSEAVTFCIEGNPEEIEWEYNGPEPEYKGKKFKRYLVPIYCENEDRILSLPVSGLMKLRHYAEFKYRLRKSRWAQWVSKLKGYRVDLEITGYTCHEYAARLVFRDKQKHVVKSKWAYWFSLGRVA